MKIVPLAFDSFSTRSMATYVETKDIKIMIDPGIAIAPIRYKLPPHKIELERMNKHWKDIVRYSKRVDVIIVTHYHYDHHKPDENIEIYKNKIVFLKHPTEKINLSQKKRAKYFIEKIEKLPDEILYSDSKKFVFGKTKIIFSEAVYHGTNPKLGYVTEVLVDDGYKFIHTSDVEGPAVKEQVDFILKHKPNMVIIDGPMTQMLGFRYSIDNLNQSIKNIVEIINRCPVETVILEHHLLRDLKWRERMKKVFEIGKKKKVSIQTCAEYIGKKDELLEAHRKELYA